MKLAHAALAPLTALTLAIPWLAAPTADAAGNTVAITYPAAGATVPAGDLTVLGTAGTSFAASDRLCPLRHRRLRLDR